MSFSTLFARGVALIGGAALQMRRLTEGSPEPAWGSAPAIPTAKPQGSIPTLKMPTAKGWDAGTDADRSARAQGQRVRRRPRSSALDRGPAQRRRAGRRGAQPRQAAPLVFDYAMVTTMRRADAMGVSANRITLLRDTDGDGVAESREVFLENQSQPFGMALVDDTFYVGNTDGVVAFPYDGRRQPHHRAGPQARHVQTRRPLDAKPACSAPTGESSTPASDRSPISPSRAWRWRKAAPPSMKSILPAASSRIFAAGLRNAVGLAWEPTTGCCGPWSTSATGSVTKRLPTISRR